MKVLIVDADCTGLSLAIRASQAGHEVKWFMQPCAGVNTLSIGQGFKGIDRIDNWVANMKWADLVIPIGEGGHTLRLEHFHKRGFPVFVSGSAGAKSGSMDLFKKVGIECVPQDTFPTMAEAEKHVRKTQKRLVAKIAADSSDKPLTYVSKNAADLIAWIQRTPAPKSPAVLQSFTKGIEFGVSRFMGKNGWLGQWNESFRSRCESNIAYFTPDSKLGDGVLAKIGDALLEDGHIGNVSIRAVVDDEGKAWPAELSCRLSWLTASAMLGATEGDPIKWMKDAIDGKDSTSFNEDIGVCFALTVEDECGIPIYGVTKGNQKHLHPHMVQIAKLPAMDGDKVVDKSMWATAGECVAAVTGYGTTIEQAARRASKTAGQLYVAGSEFHDSIGAGLKEQLPKLHKMGYATHCKYGS
jgi:phosphoribosylamine-glycine ligase